jgi:hypothetical protein
LDSICNAAQIGGIQLQGMEIAGGGRIEGSIETKR